MNISKSVLISGHVQGVWYRGWTVQQAQALNLAGWVRNLSDGRVEALFHGPRDRVDQMVALCRQGPPAARVGDVRDVVVPEVPNSGFHQRPTV